MILVTFQKHVCSSVAKETRNGLVAVYAIPPIP
jgi:hypothetical protein